MRFVLLPSRSSPKPFLLPLQFKQMAGGVVTVPAGEHSGNRVKEMPPSPKFILPPLPPPTSPRNLLPLYNRQGEAVEVHPHLKRFSDVGGAGVLESDS